MADRAVILDRDGVINQDAETYIKSLAEWIPLPGSIEAIVRLSHAGYRIAIATNQSGIARGLLPLSELLKMHQRLRNLVAAQGGRIEMIAFCPHAPDEACRCRKPQPGLLEEIASRLSIGLTGVPFVGDSMGDIRAAHAVGAVPYLVRTGKGERTLASLGEDENRSLLAEVQVYADLDAVADALLQSGYRP